jgi:hypothetical protein
MLKDADTDFPEPGENPEHSGKPEMGERVGGSMCVAASLLVLFWRHVRRGAFGSHPRKSSACCAHRASGQLGHDTAEHRGGHHQWGHRQ